MRPENWCLAGIEAFKSGDLDTAVRQLEIATIEDPRDFRAFAFLGAAYAEQGRYNAAIGCLQRAADLEPGSAKVHFNLGQAYEAAGASTEAWFEYRKALEIDSSYQPATSALAELGARLRTMRERLLQLSA